MRAGRQIRLVPALLAALAVVGVVLPVRTLLTPNAWIRPTLLIVLVVLAVGLALRLLTRSALLVGAGQVALTLWAVINVCLSSTTWASLPTLATAQQALADLEAGRQVVMRSAAPVGLTPGLVLAVVLIVGLLAIAVDLMAVTMRMPGAAGLPLLAGYVAVAANSGDGLHVGYFLLPALAWVGLMGHDGLDRLQRWGGSVARPRGGKPRDPSAGILNLARLLGVMGIAVAVLLPGVLPHLPTTFLADGLGRSDAGRGGGDGGLSDLLDVSRNLNEQSTDKVLSFTTTLNSPPPLRVDVLTEFDGTRWRGSNASLFDTAGQLPSPDQFRGASVDTSTIPRLTGVVSVEDNQLKRPQVAVPGTPTSIDVAPQDWRVDANGILRFVENQQSYQLSVEELVPSPSDYGSTVNDNPPIGDQINGEDAAPMIEKVLAQVAPEGLSPAETAWRIQAYLRSTQFTYALDLAPPLGTDADGAPLSPDPVSQFLASRRGYCVQFATAMALMARQRGIPARIGIGFLPGTLVGQTWTVVGRDAHAWPELWFPEVGWLRFEPTPGVRTGVAPAWSIQPSDTTTPTAAPTSAAPSASESDAVDDNTDTPTSTTPDQGLFSQMTRWLGDHLVAITAVLVLLLALALVPVAAIIGRRRALRRAKDDAERVEVLWESMLTRLGDVGVFPEPGDTPRQAGQRLGRTAYLDDEARSALGSVVATLERARYSPTPEADIATLDEEADRVVTSAQSRKQRSARVRALLWPREGRQAWATLGRAVARLPRRLATAYKSR